MSALTYKTMQQFDSKKISGTILLPILIISFSDGNKTIIMNPFTEEVDKTIKNILLFSANVSMSASVEYGLLGRAELILTAPFEAFGKF